MCFIKNVTHSHPRGPNSLCSLIGQCGLMEIPWYQRQDKNLSLASLTSRLIQIITKSLYSPPTEKFMKYATLIKDNK